MQQDIEQLDYFELHSLLINKNKEFTDAIKAGKKHTELRSIYTAINEVYITLRSRQSQSQMTTH